MQTFYMNLERGTSRETKFASVISRKKSEISDNRLVYQRVNNGQHLELGEPVFMQNIFSKNFLKNYI